MSWPDGIQGDMPGLSLEHCREFSIFMQVVTMTFTEVRLRREENEVKG